MLRPCLQPKAIPMPHHILVRNISQGQIQSIIMDMANLYKTTPFVQGIEIYEALDQPESFLILFPEQPDIERFAYFVNYIEYPIRQKGLSPVVVGYFDTKHSAKKGPYMVGEWLMVYVSENDDEHDEVFIATEKNETFRFSFRGRVKKLDQNEKPFAFQAIDLSNYSDLTEIIPGPDADNREFGNKSWWKFW